LSGDAVEALCKVLIKYSVKTGSPHFHNQLFSGVDPYALAASWMTEALNTSQYTYEVGPAFVLIEDAVIKTCLQLFGFDGGDGILSPGGSMSNMYGVVAARYKRFPEVKNKGLRCLPQLCVFTSECVSYTGFKVQGSHEI
jgi:glutamate/tyrosine decarboxylase-like PLP-dependent enzyme